MNETNAVPYLDQIVKTAAAIDGLPALPLVVLGCIAWGYVLKAIPRYSNRWIPFGVFTFGVILNLAVSPIKDTQDIGRVLILGIIAGVCAWVIHSKFLSRWIDDRIFQADDKQPPKDETKL